MAPRGNNSASLTRAKTDRNDEFYTQLPDIEAELRHYRHHFAGKVVYCNCDDPRTSNFVRYFMLNFRRLGLKKLIASCKSRDGGQGTWCEYESGETAGIRPLAGDGDFRSPGSTSLLSQADIVVTNPPFSLFREYVTTLIERGKQFLILGDQNAITYKEIFRLIKDSKLWLGNDNGNTKWFRVPDDDLYDRFGSEKKTIDGIKYVSMRRVYWFTNLDIAKRHENLILTERYTLEKYPHYDNFDAIEVSKTADIPEDYNGVMGVPISFLLKHNPDQFEITGITKTWFGIASKTYPRQVQVGADGRETSVTKLNDGGAMKIATPPVNKTFYKVNGEFFTQTYPRILVRRIGATSRTGPLRRITTRPLAGDGDFRSPECLAMLDEADIVVTNPPFSLFREYVATLIERGKQFVILGNQNALKYKKIFPLIKEGKLWIGPSIRSGDREFRVPDGYLLPAAQTRIDEAGHKFARVQGVRWFTNLDFAGRHENLILTERYTPEKYPHYDNFDAIEVPKTADIPEDYEDVMGVPVSFLLKYNPEQFEILGCSETGDYPTTRKYGKKERVVDGVRMKSNTGALRAVIRTESFGAGAYFDVGYPVRGIFKRLFIRRIGATS